MGRQQRKVRTRKGSPSYTYLGCPLTRNRSAWCFRLCEPDTDGIGVCGRVAPHALQGATARSIAAYNEKVQAARFAQLEQAYLADARHENASVRILEGESEIVIPIEGERIRADGLLDDAACFGMLGDAAILAVNSVIQDGSARTECFNIRFEHVAPAGKLAARARMLGRSGGRYLAESVVVDADGREICRGVGAFVAGAASA